MPIPFRLDYVIEKILSEAPATEQKVFQELTGVKLSKTEARALWMRVLEHKWVMSERLGRDVGLRVAVIDYFENIYMSRTGQKNDSGISGLMRRVLRPSIIQRIL